MKRFSLFDSILATFVLFQQKGAHDTFTMRINNDFSQRLRGPSPKNPVHVKYQNFKIKFPALKLTIE